MVNGGVRLYELGYDVWDDRYLVKGADSTRYYTSFPKMGAALEQLRSIKLIPVGDVDGAGEYSLRFSVTVHPLRSRDRAQMVEWMGQKKTMELFPKVPVLSPEDKDKAKKPDAAGGGGKSGSPTSRCTISAPARSMANARSITSMARKGSMARALAAKRGGTARGCQGGPARQGERERKPLESLHFRLRPL